MLDISYLTHLMQDDKNDTKIYDRYFQESLEGRITGKKQKTKHITSYLFIYLFIL